MLAGSKCIPRKLHKHIHWENVEQTHSLSLFAINSTIIFPWAKNCGMYSCYGSSKDEGRYIEHKLNW